MDNIWVKITSPADLPQKSIEGGVWIRLVENKDGEEKEYFILAGKYHTDRGFAYAGKWDYIPNQERITHWAPLLQPLFIK